MKRNKEIIDSAKVDSLSGGVEPSIYDTLSLVSRLEMLTAELMAAKDQAEIWRKKYASIYEKSQLGFFTINRKGVILENNLAFSTNIDCEESSLKNIPFDDFVSPEHKENFHRFTEKVFSEKKAEACEVYLAINESSKYVYLTGQVTENNELCHITLLDITERKSREINREETARLILMVNFSNNFHQCMSDLTSALQRWSGCEAVGIRLREGDDFPYYETRGFPASFVVAENHLCTYGLDGTSVLECMCGNILCGRTDPCKPFFTVNGSFWSNNTTELLATTTDADRQTRTRNKCNSSGYESVALIPLRVGDQVFGLLQFNDHRTDRFSAEMISDFEKMADCLSFALLRRKTEEALRNSEENMRFIIKHDPTAIAVYDRDLNYIAVSNRYLLDYEVKEEDIIGKHHYEVFPEMPQKWKDVHQRCLSGGIEFNDDDFFERPDGSITYNRWECRPWRRHNGEIGGIITYTEVTTQRKKAEKALKESESLFRRMFYQSTIGAAMVSLDNRFVMVNDALCRITGYSSEELISKTFVDVTHPDDIRKDLTQIKRLISREIDQYDTEKRYIKSNGSVVWINMNVSLIRDEEGSPLYFLPTMQDITIRKQNEEKIKMFTSAIEFAYDAIMITDLDGMINYANESAVEIYGYTLEELMKLNVVSLNCDPDVEKNIAEELQSVGRWSGETTCIKKNGETFPGILSLSIAKNEDGIPISMLGASRDITRLKQAEEELKNAHSELENLHVNLDEAIFSFDIVQNKMINVSRAHDAVFGYPPQAFYDNPNLWYERVIEEDKPIIDRGYAVLLSGKVLHHEYRMIHPNGELRWIEARIRPQLDKNGNLIRVDGIASNVTERKHAEAELKEKEVQYRNLANSGIALIWTSGTDKLCNYFNEPWLKFTGRTLEQEIGNGWTEGVHPEDFDNCVKTYLTAFDKHEKFDMDYRVRHASGEYRWIRDLGTPNYNSRGEFIGYIGHCFDITQHKEANWALQESEERFRLLFENSMDAVLLTIPDGTILKANAVACRIFGKSEEEIKRGGRNGIIDISDPRMEIALKEREEKGAFTGELRGLRQDGTTFPIEVSSALFQDSKGITKSSMIIKDITERKKFEEEIIKAKLKAEESDRLKSAFLANMSHEIRTPMNGILGFAELLKEPKLTGEEQQEYISIIQKSGERMLGIINDIISISKVEAGQMQVFISETNVNEILDYIYTFFKPEAEQKGLAFSYSNQLTKKEAVIETDKEKVFAVLTNLVKNAFKFTRKGESVAFGYEVKGDFYEFFVKDTGIGIPKEQIGIIFERFRQVNDSFSRKFEGAGLGLSISKAYVEMLGGKIRVESQYKVGSVFYFTIPRCCKEKINNEISAETKKQNEVDNLKILIAEDDELSLVLLTKTMNIYCREILKVRTGTMAVEVCRNNPDIDLIMMDIQMPELDGYQATQQIRQFNKEVIIIAQTAFALSGDSAKALEAGCNDYIAKPIRKSQLNELVNKYFS